MKFEFHIKASLFILYRFESSFIAYNMLEIEIVEVSVTQMGFAIILKPPDQEKVVPILLAH